VSRWVETSFVLPVGLLQGHFVGPGLEGTTELRVRMYSGSVACRFVLHRLDDLVLTVRLSMPWADLVQHVGLTSVVLPSGGSSFYFRCPGLPGSTGCGRRVRNLHLPVFGGTKALACRRCHGLTYRSQHVQPGTLAQLRTWVERQKARMRYPSVAGP
jgi:hypothetical protein